MTTKIIIKQKMSGTGTIHDLESQHYDRVIKMGNTYKYAVVLPAYYGHPATRHRTLGAARGKQDTLVRQGYSNVTILDRVGDIVDAD